MSKFRSFLAIDIEPKLKNNIKIIQNGLKNSEANIKFVSMENLHFTLKFFGDINENMVGKLSIAIKEVLNENDSLTINIKGTGAFPNDKVMKVLWVGISRNDEFINLIKNFDSKFSNLGFKKERSYTPHLTIGRMKNQKNREEVSKILKDFKGFEIGSMKIKNIYLKKSELTPKGPIYENIAIFNF
ncbi:RNA 2',3'-cyclic phosphodiesterase [Methanobrevibacter filiformis]|uniref:RNA 2',3'-cyclic phosphodiesterase n=1 Tax=Methanobrevibacter filiformis TaxID=55758 RepID=A0A166D299_9EURY|nr:RNA 2',3'-cyclic phosphodiesterase [Methanobrevibacter filiformis]KZX15130.1 2',5' RNA ligase family [Methanobrevibacter filiformis]